MGAAVAGLGLVGMGLGGEERTDGILRSASASTNASTRARARADARLYESPQAMAGCNGRRACFLVRDGREGHSRLH